MVSGRVVSGRVVSGGNNHSLTRHSPIISKMTALIRKISYEFKLIKGGEIRFGKSLSPSWLVL